MIRRPVVVAVLGLLLVLGVTAGLAAFQPWKVWTVRTVSETLPAPSGAASSAASPGKTAGGPVAVADGRFTSLAHDTSGRARVLRLADGGQVLRIEGLSTSDGPDVRVWLSAQPPDRAADARDAAWLELGRLRGNRGDLTYPLPAGTDVREYGSVVIWCKRFSVAFGAAPLTPA